MEAATDCGRERSMVRLMSPKCLEACRVVSEGRLGGSSLPHPCGRSAFVPRRARQKLLESCAWVMHTAPPREAHVRQLALALAAALGASGCVPTAPEAV